MLEYGRSDLADPLDWLTARQLATLKQVVQFAPPGLLKDLDASVFTVWVVAYDLYQEASDRLPTKLLFGAFMLVAVITMLAGLAWRAQLLIILLTIAIVTRHDDKAFDGLY